MRDNFEVVTTDDKSQRDKMFTDLRGDGNRLEKMAVKFSSNRLVTPATDANRAVYVSTWSVAYPRN